MDKSHQQKFQRYNHVFRAIITLSFLVALSDCLFPFIGPDEMFLAEFEHLNDGRGVDTFTYGESMAIKLGLSITPLLWIFALCQLMGISNEWSLGNLLSPKIGEHFQRFSYCVLVIFVADSGVNLYLDALLMPNDELDDMANALDLLYMFDLPFLVACIFLIMGSKVFNEAISLKEESDLTV